ncbi:MAG: regulatory protein [Bacillota bacterium]|nr:regulatory protein [Bacillota bacterium]
MAGDDAPGALERAARQHALRLLGRRAYTRAELKAKLAEKGLPASAIEAALLFVARCGYLNDVEVARREAERCFTEKGWGPYRVGERLRRRGLTSELIADVLAAYDEDKVRALCLAAAEKKARQLRPAGAGRVKARVWHYLARRGFPLDAIEWCLNRLPMEESETGTP